MSDTMIRTLDTDIHEDENPEQLVDEIIGYGLLNKVWLKSFWNYISL